MSLSCLYHVCHHIEFQPAAADNSNDGGSDGGGSDNDNSGGSTGGGSDNSGNSGGGASPAAPRRQAIIEEPKISPQDEVCK